MNSSSFFPALLKPVVISLCAAFAMATMAPAVEAKQNTEHTAKKHAPAKKAAPAKKPVAKKAPAGKAPAKKQQQTYMPNRLGTSAAINTETGEILECNPKPDGCFVKRSPASTTKLMTAMIVFKALKSGQIHVNDRFPLVPVGRSADSGGQGAVTLQSKTIGTKKNPIQLFPVGSELSVDTLLSAVAVSSAADATMTLSTAICGTSDCIVDLMNRELDVIFKDNPHGLHTHFANAHGMPNARQYTTAYDQAVIGAYMANNYYKEATTYFSQTSYRANGVTFPGHNQLLLTYKCDNAAGLSYKCMEFGKTGFFRTPERDGLPAMFCITAVAARNGYRVSASTLGYDSSAGRNAEEARVLDSSFTSLEYRHAPTLPKTRPMPLHFPSLRPDPVVLPEPDQSRLPKPTVTAPRTNSLH